MHVRTTGAVLALLWTSAPAALAGAVAGPDERASLGARREPAALDEARLEALAGSTFERLLKVFPVAGPRPELQVVPDSRPRAKADQRATVTVTQRLLRLCFVAGAGQGGPRSDDTGRARVAFVLAHELAHISRRDAGSFGSRAASAGVEQDADERAVAVLVVAGIDPADLQLGAFFAQIDGDLGGQPGSSHPTSAARVANVKRLLQELQARAPEWNLGWLLAVSGRFDQARDLFRGFASRYPSPAALHALALTRLLAAWRTAPCGDAAVVEWLPPLRWDPRAQIAPYPVRTAGGACGEFYRQLELAAGELEQAQAYAPAQIALSAVRLFQKRPTLDPTRDTGGVTQVGGQCPQPAPEGRTAEEPRLAADACEVSLLAQYELSGRSSVARLAAIDGLRRLYESWPADPSLSFNLARLLQHAGQEDEARALWAAFLAVVARGLHAEIARAHVGPGTEPALALTTAEDAAHAPTPVEATRLVGDPQLVATSHVCDRIDAWHTLTSLPAGSLRYCGTWGDEFVLRNRAGPLVRTVASASGVWPGAHPPLERPLFAAAGVTGEELRVWNTEAWVFRDDLPVRVVYFKSPQ